MIRLALLLLAALASLSFAIVQFGRGIDDQGILFSAIALVAAVLAWLQYRARRTLDRPPVQRRAG